MTGTTAAEHAHTGPPGLLGQALVLDETLRDGIQSPSAIDPAIDDKVRLLHLMDALGIGQLDVGLPGAGASQRAPLQRLCEEIRDARLSIKANVAAHGDPATSRPRGHPAQDGRRARGLRVHRQLADPPVRGGVGRRVHREAVGRRHQFAVSQGLQVAYVTETPRARGPISCAGSSSPPSRRARAGCACATRWASDARGTKALVRFALGVVKESGVEVGLDWHGHNDRGLSLANALAAGEAGCTRLHGCAAGIGERVGNTPSDQLLVNLKLLGHPVYGPRT